MRACAVLFAGIAALVLVLPSGRANAATAGVVDPAKSTVVVQGVVLASNASYVQSGSTTAPADGWSHAIILVTLKDSAGNPVSGKAVTITAAGSNAVSITPVPQQALHNSAGNPITGSSGLVSFQVASHSVYPAVVIIAQDITDNIPLSNSATISFTQPPATPAPSPTGSVVDAVKSTVVVQGVELASNPNYVQSGSTTAPADGWSRAIVLVTLKDSAGNPVPGKVVTLAPAGSNSVGITPVPQQAFHDSNGNPITTQAGLVSFQVTSRVVYPSVVLTALDLTDKIPLSNSATVSFTQPAAVAVVDPVKSTVEIQGPASVLADGRTAIHVLVGLTDSAGKGVTGKAVTLKSQDGDTRLQIVRDPSYPFYNSSGDPLSSQNASNPVRFLITSRSPMSAATLVAQDKTDSITLVPTVSVSFTSPSAPRAAVSVVEPGYEWDATAEPHRGHIGEHFTYSCPAGAALPEGGTPAAIYGTDTYTDDSPVCEAAVHAGLITVAHGGKVIIEIRADVGEYTASERNGVTSLHSGPIAPSGCYIFVK